jgi:type I restriction enzyme S subunit
MKHPWPLVPLGEILTARQERPLPDDLALGRVKIVGKIRFDSGRIELRADGETKTGMILVRPGDLVVSGINAAKGAIAIYGTENTEPVAATIHYGAYITNRERVSVKFLWWMLRSKFFKELLLEYVPGGIKTELKAKRLLPVPIPLPPLAEQQSIVEWIEALAGQVHEALRLRQEVVKECEILCRAILASDTSTQLVPMSELVLQRTPDVNVRPDMAYQFAGVYCFGRGLFRGQAKTGSEFAYPKLTTLKTGNFTYPKLMAWEGAFGVVHPECNGCVVSTEFPVFEVNEVRVLPEVLDIHFRNPAVWPELAGASTGTNVRRRRLNPKDFLCYKIPLPSREAQFRLRNVMSELAKLSPLHAKTAAELDALLPALLDKGFRGELA